MIYTYKRYYLTEISKQFVALILQIWNLKGLFSVFLNLLRNEYAIGKKKLHNNIILYTVSYAGKVESRS